MLTCTKTINNKEIDVTDYQAMFVKNIKEKYGELAEQKLRQTVAKLRESLTDPYTGGMSDVSVTGMPASQPQDMRSDPNAEFEKTSLLAKRKKLNRNKKR